MIAFANDGNTIRIFDPADPGAKFVQFGFDDELGVMFETGFSAGAGNFIVGPDGRVNRLQLVPKDAESVPGGSLFVDAADNELKFKRDNGSVYSITS